MRNKKKGIIKSRAMQKRCLINGADKAFNRKKCKFCAVISTNNFKLRFT